MKKVGQDEMDLGPEVLTLWEEEDSWEDDESRWVDHGEWDALEDYVRHQEEGQRISTVLWGQLNLV